MAEHKNTLFDRPGGYAMPTGAAEAGDGSANLLREDPHVAQQAEAEAVVAAAFPEVGQPRRKRELLALGVHLVTTRVDTKDGHTSFVYVIENTRRKSLSVTLDFAGSKK